MRTLTDNTMDLIVCDPPYFRILKEDWDRFKNIDDYIS